MVASRGGGRWVTAPTVATIISGVLFPGSRRASRVRAAMRWADTAGVGLIRS